MYWQASIAIVSVAAWLQMGRVMMDCLSIPALPSVGPRNGPGDYRPHLSYDIYSVLSLRTWS